MLISNYLENKLADHVVGKTSFTMPAVYLALSTANPAEDGSGLTEPSGNGYARKSTAGSDWTAASGGAAVTANALSFATATGSWGTVTHFALMDANTSGNMLAYGMLATSVVEGFALASNDTIYAPSHAFSNDNTVQVISDSLPAGLTAGTLYYVIGVSGSTFQLSTTLGGSAVNITGDGFLLIGLDRRKTPAVDDVVQFAAGALTLTMR